MKFDKVVKEMSELTEVNAHLDAYIVGAEYLDQEGIQGAERLRIGFATLLHKQEFRGYIDEGDNREKSYYYAKLKELAKYYLTPEQYQEFYMAT